MRNRVRLIDIAEKAGVSKMCVSLALRDDPSISESTRKTIRRISEEMGYVPNRIAKGLTIGRTYIIAAIVGGDLHDDYHNQFLKGATDYAIGKGYTLTIALTEGDRSIEAEIIKKFQEMSIDGYLIFHSGSKDNYGMIRKHEAPYILYTKYFPDMECSYVVCDDVHGGELLTSYFIEMGHRRIAYLFDSFLEQSSEVLNRKTGYRNMLEKNGIPFDEKLVIPYDYGDIQSVNQSKTFREPDRLLECLKSEDPPTAIFVCNDVVASYVLKKLKSWGYQVPGDISIGGYEGVYLGEVLDPPLTTVSSPIREMGRKACQLLIKKIEGQEAREKVFQISMEPTLTIRESVKRKEEK